MIKHTTLILSFITVLLVVVVFANQSGAKKFGKISLPLGKVEVQSGGAGDWKKAKPNFPVSEGDVIRTLAKSRAEITLIGFLSMRAQVPMPMTKSKGNHGFCEFSKKNI